MLVVQTSSVCMSKRLALKRSRPGLSAFCATKILPGSIPRRFQSLQGEGDSWKDTSAVLAGKNAQLRSGVRFATKRVTLQCPSAHGTSTPGGPCSPVENSLYLSATGQGAVNPPKSRLKHTASPPAAPSGMESKPLTIGFPATRVA